MKLTKAYLTVLISLGPGLIYTISIDAKKDHHILALRAPPVHQENRLHEAAPEVVEEVGEPQKPANGGSAQEEVDSAVEGILMLDDILNPKSQREVPKGLWQRAYALFEGAFSNLPKPRWPILAMSSEGARERLVAPRSESQNSQPAEGSQDGSVNSQPAGQESKWSDIPGDPQPTRWTSPPIVPEGMDSLIVQFRPSIGAGTTGIRGPIRYMITREQKMYSVDPDGHHWPTGYYTVLKIFHPDTAIGIFEATGLNLVPTPKTYLHHLPGVDKGKKSGNTLVERADLQGLDASSSTAPTKTPREIFSMYLQLFTAAQAIVGAAITPGLHNVTYQTNNTFIHQMAASIYYDLTGSTNVLLGPFNYGLNFLGNTSISQADGKPLTSEMTQSMTTLESLYTHMWLNAVAAANATGVLQQMIQIAGSLNTNDTSVYPPGFMTANKTAPIWQ